MRIRRKSYQKYLYSMLVLGFIAICVAVSLFVVKRYQFLYESEIGKADDFIMDNMRYVFVAVSDLSEGEELAEEKMLLKEMLVSDDLGAWADINDVGQTLLVDIPKGMFITKNMLADKEQQNGLYKELFMTELTITPNIETYDYCDLRIVYPNGETYIVLSKKQVYEIDEDRNTCCLWLSPEEIHLMQSGIVDCMTYSGSRFILTKYVHSNIEEASNINYSPSIQSMELIFKEMDVDEIKGRNYSKENRIALEQRLSYDWNSLNYNDTEYSTYDKEAAGYYD